MIDNKIIYYQNLKNFKKFLKIFKKIKNRLLLLYIFSNKFESMNKFSETKQDYLKYLYNNIFDKKLFWLNLKKYSLLKQISIFHLANQFLFVDKIKCIVCSRIAFVYNTEILDFYCSLLKINLAKKNNFNYQYNSLVVYDHLCTFCKRKTKTKHSIYFLKIPLYWHTFIISFTEKILFVFSFRVFLFTSPSKFLKIKREKESFTNKSIFKQIYLFSLKDIFLESLTFGLFQNAFLSLRLVHCPILKMFTRSNHLDKKISYLSNQTDCKRKKINDKKPKFLLRGEKLLKVLARLKRIKKHNNIRFKILVGGSKNLDLFLNYTS
nr:hypothetical protein CcurKRNrm2_p162 [Cryptomonas curvata]